MKYDIIANARSSKKYIKERIYMSKNKILRRVIIAVIILMIMVSVALAAGTFKTVLF